MARLPTPGSDSGSWGNILNDYLLQVHTSDGNLKAGVVGSSQLQDDSVTASAIAPGSVTKSAVGLGNVDNTSDTNKPISTATQTALDTKLTASNNLSELTSTPTARTNLGLGNSATLNVGTAAGTVAAGNDTRLSDERVPVDGSVTVAKLDGDLASSLDLNNRRNDAIESAGTLPAALGPLLSLELYSHRGVYDGNSVTPANGAGVATWTDTRSGGLSATQGTANLRPLYIEDAYASLPAIRFTTSSQLLSVADTVSLRPDSGDFYVFMVARTRSIAISSPTNLLVRKGNATSTAVGYSIFTTRSSNTVLTHLRAAGASSSRGSQTHTNSSATNLGKLSVYEMHLTGSAVSAMVNGSTTNITDGGGGPSGATYTAPISNTDSLLIGNGAPGLDVFALLVVKGALTAEQRTNVRNYLTSLYPAQIPPAVNYVPASERTLWTGGTDAPQTRIPAVVRCNDGSLVAFVELRAAVSDTGYIRIGAKRSTDNGSTWSSTIIVRDDGSNTCGNPVPVVNRSTGRLFLLSCWNLASDSESTIITGTSADTRRIYVQHSDDHGLTWSTATEITSSAKPTGGRWAATGPGAVEQLSSGRLLIPCNYTDASSNNYSYCFYSDDSGVSWTAGNAVNAAGTNETQITQTSDGSVYAYMRNQADTNKKWWAKSTDQGATWDTPTALYDLLSAGPVQGDVMTLPGDKLIATSHQEFTSTRQHLAINVSTDQGATWPAYTVICPTSAAYSDLVIQSNGTLGVIFEKSSNIVYGQFSVSYPAF